MAFTSSFEIVKGVAKLTLVGELDTYAAAQFRTQIEEVAAQKPRRIALLMKDLDYMSSAGIRELVYTKQKLGADVDLYLIGVQEAVLSTINMTGIQHSVIMLDEYDAAEIERP